MRLRAAVLTVWTLAAASLAGAAPTLRAADVTVSMTSAKSCEVTMALTVEGAEAIDHRLDSSHVDLIEVKGAHAVGDRHAIGRTQSLVLRPDQALPGRPLQSGYQIRYTALLPEARSFRCPLWLPTISTDGQSSAVAIHVEIPPGAVPSDSMPMLTWNERRGEATLGHLPVFVHVPFTPQGVPVPWSISQTMDTLTIAVIVGASLIWAWRRKR